jgi:GGDEF domain-containing protein
LTNLANRRGFTEIAAHVLALCRRTNRFTVLCSGTSADRVAAPLERLRAEFAASTLVQKYPGFSWSAGIAEFDPASDDTIEDLLRTPMLGCTTPRSPPSFADTGLDNIHWCPPPLQNLKCTRA